MSDQLSALDATFLELEQLESAPHAHRGRDDLRRGPNANIYETITSATGEAHALESRTTG